MKNLLPLTGGNNQFDWIHLHQDYPTLPRTAMSAQKAVKALARPERYPLYLYKRILRLHYGLPPPARLMGDTYVKDEFRRHKDASPEHTAVFINEWTVSYELFIDGNPETVVVHVCRTTDPVAKFVISLCRECS
ncbi:ACN9 family protein [Ancylostoma ceylanicum]|uniref:Succinate dehydrogenase assembly factor 3 n=1 Tax=Ancylostoma ceylanicum TaxID=53326 RepID=A0A0D6LBV1_9BILA|nr:ACN9 family protein [Ancylostoma ceylanicum]